MLPNVEVLFGFVVLVIWIRSQQQKVSFSSLLAEFCSNITYTESEIFLSQHPFAGNVTLQKSSMAMEDGACQDSFPSFPL